MAIREYKCVKCGALTERLLMSKAENDNPPATTRCDRCKELAELRQFPSSISIARSGMSNAPIDIEIGRDASARWADIHARQEARNKVRQEAGGNAVVEVRKNEFVPMPAERKDLNKSVTAALPSRSEAVPTGKSASKSWLQTKASDD